MNKSIRYLIYCLSILCLAFSGCTTTKISSHAYEKISEPYESLIVLNSNSDFHKRKSIEEKLTSAFQGEGITVIPSYKIIPPMVTKEKITDAILQSGIDIILFIQRDNEKEQQHILSGESKANATDSKGNTYTYTIPENEIYSSISRGFRATLIDIRKNKVIWVASSETKTLTPAELRMFSDFHDSSVDHYIKALVDEMKKSGVIRKK